MANHKIFGINGLTGGIPKINIYKSDFRLTLVATHSHFHGGGLSSVLVSALCWQGAFGKEERWIVGHIRHSVVVPCAGHFACAQFEQKLKSETIIDINFPRFIAHFPSLAL